MPAKEKAADTKRQVQLEKLKSGLYRENYEKDRRGHQKNANKFD